MADVLKLAASLRFRGDYSPTESYAIGDVVRLGKQFAIALQPNKGKRPVEGNIWTIIGGAAAQGGGGRGRPGVGVPPGGTTGQVLTKKSNASFSTEWTDQTGGSGGLSQAQVLARQSCF